MLIGDTCYILFFLSDINYHSLLSFAYYGRYLNYSALGFNFSSVELAKSSSISVCIFSSLYVPYISYRYFLVYFLLLIVLMIYHYDGILILWHFDHRCLKNHFGLYVNGEHRERESILSLLKDIIICHLLISQCQNYYQKFF